ncbi:methyltransferase domain-containing protein [bacterium]|nr:methyltransferase domain-containing protein [bacterium]
MESFSQAVNVVRTSLAAVREQAPYTAISPFYDDMMAHVDYAGWAVQIEGFLRKYGNGVRKVLDAGCGTGTMVRLLNKRGFRAAGFDRSAAMIARARAKGIRRVWAADLFHPACREGWDAVLCLYDTIHYVSPPELKRAFRILHGLVRRSGLLIFDIVTERMVMEYWMDYTERSRNACGEYVRRSWYDRKTRCQHTEIRVHRRDGGAPLAERHRQWIYPVKDVERALEQQGFEGIRKLDSETLKAGGEDAERLYVLARRR